MIARLSPAQRAVLAVAAVRLTLAEALWASTLHGRPGWFGEDTDERIAVLLGLGTEDGHDEPQRPPVPAGRRHVAQLLRQGPRKRQRQRRLVRRARRYPERTDHRPRLPQRGLTC